MSQQVHVLRLGPARRHGSYRDYKSGLYLTYPEKVEGVVPFGADISNLYVSVKMRQLEDVNGTIVAAYEASKKPTEKTPEAVAEQAQPKKEPETTPDEVAVAAPADDLLETALPAEQETKKKRNSSKK